MTCQNPESNFAPGAPSAGLAPGARSVPQLIKRSISVIGSMSVLQVQERVSSTHVDLRKTGHLVQEGQCLCPPLFSVGSGTASHREALRHPTGLSRGHNYGTRELKVELFSLFGWLFNLV